MKISLKSSCAAIVLTVSLIGGKALAHGGGGGGGGGGHSMGGSGFSRPSSSFNSSNANSSNGFRSNNASLNRPANTATTNTAQVNNFKQTSNVSQVNKPTGNVGQVSKQTNLAKQNGLNNPNNFKQVSGNNKSGQNGWNKSNGNKNSKPYDKYCKNKNWPGNCCWGFGFGFGFGGCYGDYCSDDSYCCDPWCSPCYNVCYQYSQPNCTPGYSPDGTPAFGQQDPTPGPTPTPDPSPSPVPTPSPSPVARTVHLVNPAETQTTLGFAVNGQAYTLEAGQSQDITINDATVVEFDRGSDNQTGRYTLTDGTYRFASTPQGWELFHGDAAAAQSVATN